MTAMDTLRAWAPPVLVRLAARWSGRALTFDPVPGNDWALAQTRSSGYDDELILRRVVAATREIVAGRAAFERDSVLFDRWQPPFQLLAPLLRHALRHGGHLDVIDFGGSLGSTYRQCTPFLPFLGSLRWQVIEQAAFVAAGRAEFASDVLSFHASIDELPRASTPRLLLASSVLQYLGAPLSPVDAWEAQAIDTLVIDRTPVWGGDNHRVCVQHVPRWIYPASYPCWILSRPRLLERLERRWRLLCEFDCSEGQQKARGGPVFEFKGFILERRSA